MTVSSAFRKTTVFVLAMLVSIGVTLGGVATRNDRADAAIENAMLTLTFDDGWSTQFTNVRPEMNARGLKGTFLVISQAVAQSYACCLSPAQVLTLQADGNEIGSHSVDHSDLATLSAAAVDAQLKRLVGRCGYFCSGYCKKTIF